MTATLAAAPRHRMRRAPAEVPLPRLARVTGISVALALLLAASAWASSDVYSNVGPGAGAIGGLAERYPLSSYALDQHFDAVKASITGGVDVSGVPPMLAYFLANTSWQITAFCANALITVFTFAFSLDLVNGSRDTGGAGALGPVSDAVRAIYSNVFGEPWLVVAVVLTGLWAIWRGLVQRRYTETAGSLGLSVVFVVIALAFVTQPERTIGQASQWSNRMSAAFLSLTSAGGSGERQAKRAASDQLFSLLVSQPWSVLEFGGTEHCTRDGTGSDVLDPVSVPVRPLSSDPDRDSELRRQLDAGAQVAADGKTCINNQAKYAPHFLRYTAGSDDRTAEYDALNAGDAGKLPDSDPAKHADDYRLAIADKPASDAMEKDGQYQRLLIAVVCLLAELGAFLLLGALSIGVILAQVLVLLLLAFAPVALVVGVFPGRGHAFFESWLTRLVGFLLRKAVYALILAVLLAVAGAVGAATSPLGWLLSFSLQAGFFWTVFLWRHQLADTLLAATAGSAVGRHEGLGRLASTYSTARLATRRGRRLGRLAAGPDRSDLGASERRTRATGLASQVAPATRRQPIAEQRVSSEPPAKSDRAEGTSHVTMPAGSHSQAKVPDSEAAAERTAGAEAASTAGSDQTAEAASRPRVEPARTPSKPRTPSHAQANAAPQDEQPTATPPQEAPGGRAERPRGGEQPGRQVDALARAPRTTGRSRADTLGGGQGRAAVKPSEPAPQPPAPPEPSPSHGPDGSAARDEHRSSGRNR